MKILRKQLEFRVRTEWEELKWERQEYMQNQNSLYNLTNVHQGYSHNRGAQWCTKRNRLICTTWNQFTPGFWHTLPNEYVSHKSEEGISQHIRNQEQLKQSSKTNGIYI